MHERSKEILASVLICAGWGFGTVVWWGAAIVPWLLVSDSAADPAGWLSPPWAQVMMPAAAVGLVAGIVLGSRGVGKPLTFQVLVSMHFKFPRWVFVVAYLASFAFVFVMRI